MQIWEAGRASWGGVQDGAVNTLFEPANFNIISENVLTAYL